MEFGPDVAARVGWACDEVCSLFVPLTMVVCVTGGIMSAKTSVQQALLEATNENFVCLPHNLNYDAPLVDRVLEGTTVVT